MLKNWLPCALAALVCVLLAGRTEPASAAFFGSGDQPPAQHIPYVQTAAAERAYAQARPHVTIYPRHRVLRYCRSWLAKEFRVSGTVIVPRMSCWWE
jgi:hypothetical protein